MEKIWLGKPGPKRDSNLTAGYDVAKGKSETERWKCRSATMIKGID